MSLHMAARHGIGGRWLRPTLGLGTMLVVALLLSLSVGVHSHGPAEVWHALTAFDGSQDHRVVRELRLPRAVLASVAGSSLGVAGVLIQTLTRNRIASPDILGLNAGAALAVVVANVWLGVDGLTALSAAAAGGALMAALAVYGVAVSGGAMSPARTVLAGMTFAGLLMSLVEVVLTTDEASLEQLLFWLAGSFEGRPLQLAAANGWILGLGLLAALAVARPLDTLATDDDTARNLGVPLHRVRSLAFLATAALTGGAVAIAGPVGFIGLVAPHAARWLAGPHHRDRIIVAAVAGALLGVGADVAARFVIHPGEAPVGAVTALIGAPVLVLLLRRRLA
ncbi:MAG TPA: iron ABC transporter permease [Azospirillaceae bacterium]|nr:iron ABC transporter permease [Azospirillaceae bacterium]